MRTIELLAPARNLECGIEAIRHGADAVYIGAPRFGARAAAGNSVQDIAELTRYAHLFGVKIYSTVNTLLHDDELKEVDNLVGELAAAGVDALIVQDVQLKKLVRGRLPLHASTQMDNRTVEDVQSRAAEGYEQTVLARELSIDEIRAIHEAVPGMPLEAFVHGALCVSYSGRCYASEYCFGRSANRGECAQFCRLPFDLVDGKGRIVTDPRTGKPLRSRHLLSLRDMNRAVEIEEMMDAGVSSFKIEGRLKDVAYVKNTTAYYSGLIDEVIRKQPDKYCRASHGHVKLSFTPNLEKSFNRRFTDYFLRGRTPNLACLATPKAIGEPVGTVKDVLPGRSLAIAGTASFANGDGLCFFDADDRLQGFRVNRVDQQGRLFPADPSVLAQLKKGMSVYRNLDAEFERQLSRPTADRRVAVSWSIDDCVSEYNAFDSEEDKPEVAQTGFRLTLRAEDGREVHNFFSYPHELARTPQDENIRKQLSRLGDTVYSTTDSEIDIRFADNWFIPSSVLAEWRRLLCNLLDLKAAYAFASKERNSLPEVEAGACNHTFDADTPLMTCRYCLRYELGCCIKHKNTGGQGKPLAIPAQETLAIRLADGRLFPLRFDCQRCEMLVLRPEH